MKTFLLFILATFNLYSQNEIKEIQLKGNVSSCRIYEYVAVDKFGEIMPEKELSRVEYIYQANNLLKEKSSFNPEDKLIFKIVNKYIEQDKLIDMTGYDLKSNIKWKNKFKYNPKGSVSEIAIYNFEGKIDFKEVFKYNADELLSEQITYNNMGNVYSKIINKYLGKDLLSSEKYDFNGYLVHTNVYEYRNDKLYKESTKINNSVSSNKIYNYDDNNNISEIIYYNAKDKIEKKELFNEMGDIYEEMYYTSNSQTDYTITYEYEMDNNSNWVQMIKYKNTLPLQLTKREINYFE